MQEMDLGDSGTKMAWWIESVYVGYPDKDDSSLNKKITPRECRERGMIYDAPMHGTFCYSIDDGPAHTVQVG